MKRGVFVVLEGVDGSGTTTQARALAERIRARGIESWETREPSTGPVGQFLRGALTGQLVRDGLPTSLDWRAMALLFAADRADHLEAEIIPALSAGKWVVCDRYLLSSLVYQSATSSDPAVGLELVRAANRAAISPTVTFVFDVPAEVAAERRRARGQARELYEQDDLQRRLAELYLRAEELLPEHNVVHVDATRPIQELTDGLLSALDGICHSAGVSS